ncbi:putative inositol monophosphatase [Streptomyces sp. NBRC 110611]|uniref:inositol monophosphatase family protein n=1 Tax=Streptomyces sp. NBRC 110611 TaxID=1621259 RepID=UPI00083116E8|nr:inositol monophosphatase [Streptomyces sp. NBRC 110611]GAU65119.1 putative inositol monophosphatase [Streptomyces sp. NBRC 110611]
MSDAGTLLSVAEEAVGAGTAWLDGAGRERSQRQRRFKPSGEEVTPADVEIERVVSEVLRRRSPGIPVIGEESAGEGAARGAMRGAGEAAEKTSLPPRCWLLDPIDGTMNFTRGAPFYAVSLAYVEDGRPRLGVIDAPALRRRWRTGSPGGGPHPTARAGAVREAVIGITGTGSGDPGLVGRRLAALHSTAYRIRMQGAMSLDLVGVAEGWLDACVCLGPKPWDVAAGVALVREQGKEVLGGSGRDFAFDSPVLVAGDPAVTRDLLALWLPHADDR